MSRGLKKAAEDIIIIAMKDKPPEDESVRGRIGDFETLKRQITREVLEAMMNGYSDEQFWTDECLSVGVKDDRAFGTKIWAAFDEIIQHAGIKNSEKLEDRELVEEFSFLSQILMRADLPISPELKIAAVRKIKQDFIKRGFSEEVLSGANLMKLAYIGEAEVMEKYGLDWRIQQPFTFELRLNPEHPTVQEVLAEEQTAEHELSAAAIKNDSDLAKIFAEYYKGKKPPVQ